MRRIVKSALAVVAVGLMFVATGAFAARLPGGPGSPLRPPTTIVTITGTAVTSVTWRPWPQAAVAPRSAGRCHRARPLCVARHAAQSTLSVSAAAFAARRSGGDSRGEANCRSGGATQLDSTPCDLTGSTQGAALDSEGCPLLLSRGSVQSLNVPWGSVLGVAA